MEEIRSISRESLYELVWQRPIAVLAPEFEISGPGLKKLCERNGIPVPERGYWAKVQYGKRIRRRPPLPALKPGQREQIYIKRRRTASAIDESTISGDIQELLRQERTAAEPIPVPQSPKTHPLVTTWPKPQKPSYGVADWSPNAEARRRRIASVLFREIERLGGAITGETETKFVVSLAGEKITVRLRERLKKVVIAGDKNAKSYWDRDDRTQWHPTGLLQFRIENNCDVAVRREVNETEDKPLERKLRDIIVSLILAVEAERQYRRRIEEWHQRYERDRQAAFERQERERKERERVAHLLASSKAWADASLIRSFVAAVAEKEGAVADAWASWALSVADRMDPISDIRASRESGDFPDADLAGDELV